MRLRRCTVLYLEPREEAAFDLASLLAGGNGLRRTRRWLALAPHLEMEVEVDADERELLGLLGPGEWTERDGFDAGWQPAIGRLLSEGLLIGDDEGSLTHAERDGAVRAAHWWEPALLMHRFSRWQGLDSVA